MFQFIDGKSFSNVYLTIDNDANDESHYDKNDEPELHVEKGSNYCRSLRQDDRERNKRDSKGNVGSHSFV
ncbi:17821_t:CDS:1, partial [Gigaspora rosea]